MDKIIVPEDVKFILKTLNDNGYQSFIVGGCVRDSLLGIKPKDWDITTDATPEEIKKIFWEDRKNLRNNYPDNIRYVMFVPTGEKYGTITLNFYTKKYHTSGFYEITTFRSEQYSKTGERHPEVIWGKSIEEDLSRRDFTINALAMDLQGNLIDIYCGQKNLEEKIIKCVGTSIDRFMEDPLRIYRMIRFALRYNFEIDKETFDAAKQIANGSYLKRISKERKLSEMREILKYARNKKYDFIYEDFFKSGLDKFMICDSWQDNEPFINVIIKATYNKDNGEFIPENLLLTSKECKSYKKLKGYLFFEFDKNYNDLINLNIDLDDEEFEMLCKLRNENIKRFFVSKLNQLMVDGNQMKSIGYKDKQVGDILYKLLFNVMSGDIFNKKEDLINFAKENYIKDNIK